jgi:SAM-dependent methyltransferase
MGRAAAATGGVPLIMVEAMPIHESASRGFEREAQAYERGRPAYPAGAIDWLSAQLGLGPGKTVLDVGAGTGKLTRLLSASGATVIAVEPVAAMRALLERMLPHVEALEGTAEALPIGVSTVDAVVVGQAFHWFDAPAALSEFHRVLRPGGRLGLVWNVRDRRQALQREIDEITEPLRGDTPSQAGRAWRDGVAGCELFKLMGEFTVPFELELDRGTFVDRITSISFIAALDDQRREAVTDRVRRLAEDHPEPWAYVTEVYVYERVEAS